MHCVVQCKQFRDGAVNMSLNVKVVKQQNLIHYIIWVNRNDISQNSRIYTAIMRRHQSLIFLISYSAFLPLHLLPTATVFYIIIWLYFWIFCSQICWLAESTMAVHLFSTCFFTFSPSFYVHVFSCVHSFSSSVQSMYFNNMLYLFVDL